MNFLDLPDFHNGYCISHLFYTYIYQTSRIAIQLRIQMDTIRAGKDLALYPGYSPVEAGHFISKRTCTATAICLPTPDINLSLRCALYWSSPNTLRSDNASMGTLHSESTLSQGHCGRRCWRWTRWRCRASPPTPRTTLSPFSLLAFVAQNFREPIWKKVLWKMTLWVNCKLMHGARNLKL